MTPDEILSRLERVRPAGRDKWMARCPAHADKTPSLSIRIGRTGSVLLKCFAGCSRDAILASAGLTAGMSAQTQRVRSTVKPPPKLPAGELAEVAKRCASAMTDERMERFAKSLGLGASPLLELKVGWAAQERMWSSKGWMTIDAYTFPMTDADGRCIGIRIRKEDGKKFSWTGGSEGLFRPHLMSSATELHICEGPTSCAALLQCGFNAIGRPSCTGGTQHIKRLLSSDRRKRDVIIWGDCDEKKERPDGSVFYPGQDGANALSLAILPLCRSVRVVIPPSPEMKDPRAMLNAGWGRAVLETLMKAAAYVVIQQKKAS